MKLKESKKKVIDFAAKSLKENPNKRVFIMIEDRIVEVKKKEHGPR